MYDPTATIESIREEHTENFERYGNDPVYRKSIEDRYADAFSAAEGTPPVSAPESVPAVEPNAELESMINTTMAEVGADGKRYYDVDPAFRERLEKLRADLHAGRKFDPEAERKAFGEILGMRTTEPKPEDFVESDVVQGYEIAVDDFVFDPKDPELNRFLGNAKADGMSQDSVSQALRAYCRGLPTE